MLSFAAVKRGLCGRGVSRDPARRDRALRTPMVHSKVVRHSEPEFYLLSRRNNSLTPQQRWGVFGGLVLVSVGMAAAFAYAGAWLILPYSVAELSLLFWAFRRLEARSHDWERIELVDDQLVLEASRGGELRRYEFNRLWARVDLGGGRKGSRPLVRYAGRDVEFGDHLPVDDRQRVVTELRSLLARTR